MKHMTLVKMSVLGFAFLLGCGKGGDQQQQQANPYGYQPPACAAGQVIDFRSGQCITAAQYQAQTSGQPFQGTLNVVNAVQYKKFIKEYTTGSIGFCGTIDFSGFHDCYSYMVGTQAVLNARFPAFIQSASPASLNLITGQNQYNAVQLPITLPYYAKTETQAFVLQADGPSGTFSWKYKLKVLSTTPVVFDAPSGTITSTAIGVSMTYDGIEIASGTINRQ